MTDDLLFSDRVIAEKMTAAFLGAGASPDELLVFANELMVRALADHVWTESASGPIPARSDRSRYAEYMLTGRYDVPQSVIDACCPIVPQFPEACRS